MKGIRLATTTSAQDSGLLDQLLPRFESESGYRVRVQAVGSGMAMDLARKGNADVLLVHDPESERKLLDEGIGADRRLVMHNDFVLAGPPADPAGIRGLQSITEAFRKIAEAGSPFVSRGDASGTDRREKTIWQRAGLEPGAAKYSETKSGMAETLAAAVGKKSYVLTDRATFLAQRHNLEIMVEGDDLLLNMYHVMRVNPGKFPGINSEGAERLAGFMVSPGAQQIIEGFMREGSGRLFIPDAGKTEQDVLRDWKQSPA